MMSLRNSGWHVALAVGVAGFGLTTCSDRDRTAVDLTERVSSAVTTANWENLGPAPVISPIGGGTLAVSGRVNGIAADPNNAANHWLIGTEGGGIWETFDGGNTWAPRTDQQASLTCGTAASPTRTTTPRRSPASSACAGPSTRPIATS